MPYRFVARRPDPWGDGMADLCLVHGAHVGQIRFAPCASVLASGGELHWREEGKQLKLAGSELCLAPRGAAWLGWLVPQRLALASCAVSLHQWASTSPLCDMAGTCYGRLGARPHPLAVRNRQETLLGERLDWPAGAWAALLAMAAALLAVAALAAHDARARAARASACAVDAHAEPAAAEPGGARMTGGARAGSPACSAAGAQRGEAGSPFASPGSLSACSFGSAGELTPGAFERRAPLSPIDETAPRRAERAAPARSPGAERAGALPQAGGSAFKIWKAPRPPGATTDSSSSGGSSIALPEASDENGGANQQTAKQPRPGRAEAGYLVMRPRARPEDKPPKKKHGGGSTSERLLRAVSDAAEALSPAKLAQRLSPKSATSAAEAREAPLEAAQAPLSDDSSSEEEPPTRGAAGSYSLKGSLQESLLERSCRMHRPLAAGKARCAACLESIKQMSLASPRVMFVECGKDCGRVWHPKCLPSGDKTRQRAFVCAECQQR